MRKSVQKLSVLLLALLLVIGLIPTSVMAANNPGVFYQTHVENIGWENDAGIGSRGNGQESGTYGKNLRLEGIKVIIDTQGYDLGVSYQTHIQNIGWEADAGIGWQSNGNVSGTRGKSLRLEEIQIKLIGSDADKFDIYYQVHAQNVGWMGWAKNGESAGTAGFGYRLEAIRIKIVPAGSAAPGSTENSFIKNVAIQQTNIPLEKAGYASIYEVFEEMTGQWTDGNGQYIYFSNRSHEAPIQYRGPIITPAGDRVKASGQYSIDESDTTKIKIIVKLSSGGASMLDSLKYIDVGIKGDNKIYIENKPWTYVSDEPLVSF